MSIEIQACENYDKGVILWQYIVNTDYFKEGRNLERLGISGLSPDQLQKLLDEG